MHLCPKLKNMLLITFIKLNLYPCTNFNVIFVILQVSCLYRKNISVFVLASLKITVIVLERACTHGAYLPNRFRNQ